MGTSKRKYVCAMDYPLNMEKHHWNWIWLGAAHIFGVQGWAMLFLGLVPRAVFFAMLAIGHFAGLGITIGCHRYWAHRTFKAKLPLQIILAFAQTLGVQYPIFKWCRDHRIHHKFTETAADPHDATRGFFFSHMGWLFTKEDEAVKEKEAVMDLSDLDNDPVVRFQSRWYWPLLILCHYVIPISIMQWLFPTMSLYQTLCINYAWYVVFLHLTWLVNSAAHMYGHRPYDGGIHASENLLVAIFGLGEGWHNYHHVFPWDYKTAELGVYAVNFSALLIDFLAWIGLAYDLKTVPHEVVLQRVHRTGNKEGYNDYHTKPFYSLRKVTTNAREERKREELKQKEDQRQQPPPWGWGDSDIPLEHFEITQRIRPSKAA